MAIIFTTWVVGNEEASVLIGELAKLGVPRTRVQVLEPETVPEHGTDAYSTWNLLGGVWGMMLGGALGWVAMLWSNMPWIGALWGAAVGSITGARFGGYAVADSTTTTPAPSLPSTPIEIEAKDSREAEQIRQLCGPRCRSRIRQDVVTPEPLPDPANPPG